MNEPDVLVGIGDAAGDGVASAGNTRALLRCPAGSGSLRIQQVLVGYPRRAFLVARSRFGKEAAHPRRSMWHPYRRPLHALQRLCGSCEADRRHVRQTVT